MESLFPQFFFLSYFAPVMIRLAIGVVFLYDAVRVWKHNTSVRNRVIAVGCFTLGVAIGIGFLTQLAALIGIGGIIFISFFNDMNSVFKNNVVAFLALAILVFLLVTGPGGFAIDLPY